MGACAGERSAGMEVRDNVVVCVSVVYIGWDYFSDDFVPNVDCYRIVG